MGRVPVIDDEVLADCYWTERESAAVRRAPLDSLSGVNAVSESEESDTQ